MKFNHSNHSRRSSNAYGHYNSRLRLVVVRCRQNENDNGERKRQSDNDERRTEWQAASKTVSAAWRGLAASKLRKKTLLSVVLAKAGFFYETPLAAMRGIVKIPLIIFKAACRKIATLTRKGLQPAQTFETRQLLWCGRVLKILVSVVQFRPEPPLSYRSADYYSHPT